MKNIIFILMSLSIPVLVEAQNENFENNMYKNIITIDSCFKSPEATINLAETFEQIANSEKKQYLPLYYASYCYAINAFMQKDPVKIDQLLDKAESLINQADSLKPENSEITCIKSLIASARIIVNPMQRGMQYGQLVSQMIELAKKEDPNNPRTYYLQAQSLMYTPEQYGGGCKNAKPLLEMAINKFNTFTPESRIHPSWGMEDAKKLLKQCK
jgi:hypothetical protein